GSAGGGPRRALRALHPSNRARSSDTTDLSAGPFGRVSREAPM
ncbi:MAG: hypothetical protein AVDCRST_MAG65-2243, partial [uncultured Solirubrobacteraceae bacterium]